VTSHHLHPDPSLLRRGLLSPVLLGPD
jgi:hypothetical protein